MKKILFLLTLTACVSSRDAEDHLGLGATCVGTAHGAYICSYKDKQYVCMAHDEGCAQDVSCVETVGGLK